MESDKKQANECFDATFFRVEGQKDGLYRLVFWNVSPSILDAMRPGDIVEIRKKNHHE